jgi:hypothetical protein
MGSDIVRKRKAFSVASSVSELMERRIPMTQTKLLAASAAALILACVAGWAVSDTQARVAAPATVQIDPFTLMTSAKQLPTEHFADYSFVF